MAEKTIKDKLVTVAGIIPQVYESGIEEGKVREREAFWNALLQDGNRTDFEILGVFSGYSWDFNNFYPTRDIVVRGDATNLFYNWRNRSAQRGSLIQRLSECRVRLDTSQATVLTNLFNYTYITEVPTIDFSNAPNSTSCFAHGFADLKKIEKVIVTPSTTYTSWFTDDSGLEEIRVEGTIAQDGFDISYSKKLSKASIESIITHLSDTTADLTVILSETACRKAFNVPEGEDMFSGSAEWCELVFPKPNWNITLLD